MVVGFEHLDRPILPWNKDLPGYGDKDVLFVEMVEVGEPLSSNVEWIPSAVEYVNNKLKSLK
jgi:hypothetical protein